MVDVAGLGGLTGKGKAVAINVMAALGAVKLPGRVNEFVTHRRGHLKILDLFFYDQMDQAAASRWRRARARQVKTLSKTLALEGFDTRLLGRLLRCAPVSFPVQAAVEILDGRLIKFKLYFSNVLNETPAMLAVIRRVVRILEKPMPRLDVWSEADGIDCIGVDLLPGGGVEWKLYPLFVGATSLAAFEPIARETFKRYGVSDSGLTRFLALARRYPAQAFGFLYRIEGDGVSGVKCWYRLATPVKDRQTGLKLSYLTCGNGVIERYLREWEPLC